MRERLYRNIPSYVTRKCGFRIKQGKWFRRNLFIHSLSESRYAVYETFLDKVVTDCNRFNYIHIIASPNILHFYRC